MTAHFLIARAIAKAMGGEELSKLVETPLRELSMPEHIRQEILNPPLTLDQYETMSKDVVLAKASDELWSSPFSDCGPRRTYQWRALGITWRASCENNLSVIPYVEEFVAVLQIATADLACIDLCLLPTSVELEVEVADVERFRLKQRPDNARLVFRLQVPRVSTTGLEEVRRTQGEVLAVANTLLVWCSCLPDAEIDKRLRTAYKNELSAKAFLVRPYWELFREFVSPTDYESRHTEINVDLGVNSFRHREHLALGWNKTPGFGYSREKATGFLRNRYRRAVMPICKTLTRLRKSGRFRSWVVELRNDGLLDWQILVLIANAVVDYRVKKVVGAFAPEPYTRVANELINRDETEEDVPFQEEILYSGEIEVFKKSNVVANARTWNLEIRSETPDFSALKRLLDVRYFQATDDIPHDDLVQEDRDIA